MGILWTHTGAIGCMGLINDFVPISSNLITWYMYYIITSYVLVCTCTLKRQSCSGICVLRYTIQGSALYMYAVQFAELVNELFKSRIDFLDFASSSGFVMAKCMPGFVMSKWTPGFVMVNYGEHWELWGIIVEKTLRMYPNKKPR